jgi:hypothetical protein
MVGHGRHGVALSHALSIVYSLFSPQLAVYINRIFPNVLVRMVWRWLKTVSVYIVDAQCGDMSWMSVFLQGRDDIHYTGQHPANVF